MSPLSLQEDNGENFSAIEDCSKSQVASDSFGSTPSTASLEDLDRPLAEVKSSYNDDNIIIAGIEEVKTPWSTLRRNLSDEFISESPKLTMQSHDKATDGIFHEDVTSTQSIVAVIGTGYVGYLLATLFGAHYEVLAFDVSAKRIEEISKELKQFPLVTPTSNPDDLSKATHFLIAVPTQILPSKGIDISCVENALSTIEYYACPEATVVIESSVAVGMTRQLLEPLMRTRGFKAGMSPERVDPGRSSPAIKDIPKLISGLDDITPGSLKSISDLYSNVFSQLVTVSSPEVAEMTKLYENCQRMVCIAYANEMADACLEHSISPFEVSAAASTKPFGYQPMYPSLGVGGHCIPVNPFYLFSSSQYEDTFPLLRIATKRMSVRPAEIADRIMTSLFKSVMWRSRLALGQQPRALVCGVAFKPGQSVLSNSPGCALLNHLSAVWAVNVNYVDPLVNQEMVPSFKRLNHEVEWNFVGLQKYDIIIVAMRQIGLDYSVLESLASFTDVKPRVHWCCP